jgi:hypothetical protein
MIKKIKAVYIDEDGKKTEESLVIEILVNNKGQPDFKQKSEILGYCRVTEDSGSVLYTFLAIYTNNYLLADFGEAFSEKTETSTSPQFFRYFRIPTVGIDLKVGKSLLIEYSGQKYPYQISRIEDFK